MKLHLRISAIERLLAAVSVVQASLLVKTPCWVWAKSVCNKGYGLIRVDNRTRRAHIVAWEFATGRRVKHGYTLDHQCRVKNCVRPSHMEEVTRSENTARGNYANPRSTEHLRKKR